MLWRPSPMPPASPVARELDEPTLLQAQQGEEHACRVLVECYQRRVFAVLSRLLGPSGKEQQVEDLAQETFLRVFRHLKGFEQSGPAKLSTWILTIATRVGLDTLRRKEGEKVQLDDTLHSPHGGEQHVEQRMLKQAVDKALTGLTAEQRAVVALRAYHGFSYEEIAHALGVEVGTVKSRMARAKAALQEALGGAA